MFYPKTCGDLFGTNSFYSRAPVRSIVESCMHAGDGRKNFCGSRKILDNLNPEPENGPNPLKNLWIQILDSSDFQIWIQRLDARFLCGFWIQIAFVGSRPLCFTVGHVGDLFGTNRELRPRAPVRSIVESCMHAGGGRK